MKRLPLIAALLALALAGCAGQAIQRKDGSSSVRGFSLRDLAKSDVDSVIEIHQQEAIAALRALAAQLYELNPEAWKKSGHASPATATAALFRPLPYWQVAPQKSQDWKAALNEAGRPDFAGDRVASLIGGLLVMHMAAYNHQTEFFLLSEIDAQKLYNAARNTEFVAWEVATRRDAAGAALLRSEHADPARPGIERAFGRLVGIQDTLARVIEDKSNRAIRFGVVNAASMVLLPI